MPCCFEDLDGHGMTNQNQFLIMDTSNEIPMLIEKLTTSLSESWKNDAWYSNVGTCRNKTTISSTPRPCEDEQIIPQTDTASSQQAGSFALRCVQELNFKNVCNDSDEGHGQATITSRPIQNVACQHHTSRILLVMPPSIFSPMWGSTIQALRVSFHRCQREPSRAHTLPQISNLRHKTY